MSPLLSIRNLTTRFRLVNQTVTAVDAISFDVEPNEIVAIVGESGCGKSVTLLSVLGLVDPPGEIDPASEILFEGLDLRCLAEEDLAALQGERMGMIFQDPYLSLDPKMPIREIVTEPLLENRLISRAGIDGRAAELLDIVGIARAALKNYPHEFSGGRRQRISIARAISVRPGLIICDEPVSSLDVSIQSQVLNLLIDIQREYGVATLFIAHNLAVVFYMSDLVAVMYAGRIVEMGGARELHERPLHPYTRLLQSVVPEIGRETPIFAVDSGGEIPSMIHPPAGCAFYDRCPVPREVCRSAVPPTEEVSAGHTVACYAVVGGGGAGA